MRFLFCPLASHGFVFPMIGIAQALKRRGHEVAFVTGASFESRIASEHLERIPRGAPDGPSFEVSRWTDPLAVGMQILHVEYALTRFPPDALITSHLAFGPLMVGELHGIPVGILGSAAYLWSNMEGANTSPHSEVDKHAAWIHQQMIEDYNRSRQYFGLSILQKTAATASMLGNAYLIQSVPELEGNVDHLPVQAQLVGSCLWEPVEDDPILLRWLAEAQAAHEPIVYVQHGRLFHLQTFWPLLTKLFEGRSIRVAASLAGLGNTVPVTSSHYFIRDHVMQGPVLARASAAVLTANATAVLGALVNGVPMLLTPGGGEQPILAHRCVRAGAALCVSATTQPLDEPHFMQLLDRLLVDDGLRSAAQRLQRALHSVNGIERAADLFEQMAFKKGSIG